MINKIFLMVCVVFLSACGSGSDALDFSSAVGIASGNGVGTELSGSFSVRFEVKSSGCDDVSGIEAPTKGTVLPLEVEVTQANGAISFDKIDDVFLRGGINFDNSFVAGGTEIVDRGGFEDNILKIVKIEGIFEDPNIFSGKGEERLLGKIEKEDVDCSFRFEFEGIRKE